MIYRLPINTPYSIKYLDTTLGLISNWVTPLLGFLSWISSQHTLHTKELVQIYCRIRSRVWWRSLLKLILSLHSYLNFYRHPHFWRVGWATLLNGMLTWRKNDVHIKDTEEPEMQTTANWREIITFKAKFKAGKHADETLKQNNSTQWLQKCLSEFYCDLFDLLKVISLSNFLETLLLARLLI